MIRRKRASLLRFSCISIGLPIHALSAQEKASIPVVYSVISIILLCIIVTLSIVIGYLLRQHKKKQTLSQPDQFYKKILELDLEGYVGINGSGKLIEVNKAYSKMSGYSKKELLRMHVKQLEGLETPTDIAHHFEFIQKHGSDRFETIHKKKDGTLFPVELSVTVIEHDPLFLACFISDLTEQKAVEAAFNHSTDLMRYVIEHSRSAIAVHDREMRYLYVSKRYVEEFKVSDSNIIGKNHYEVFPDLPQKWRDVHKRCLAGEVLSAEDDLYEHENGSVEWTRWECRPWFAKTGEIAGIIIYTEVITERKQFEIELRRTKEFLEKLIKNANAPIIVWDAEKRITRFNHAFEVLTGRTQQEVLQQPLEMLFPPEIKAETMKRIEYLSNSSQKEGSEIQIMHTDGTIHTLLWTSSVVLDEQEKDAIATIAQGQDITSRKLAESKVEEQLQELQRWYQVMVDRENRIIELKGEVNRILMNRQEQPLYTSPFEENLQ